MKTLYDRIAQLEREIECSNHKWRMYEEEYILPAFKWATEIGFDLRQAVADNPGKNCVRLLVEHLINQLGFGVNPALNEFVCPHTHVRYRFHWSGSQWIFEEVSR